MNKRIIIPFAAVMLLTLPSCHNGSVSQLFGSGFRSDPNAEITQRKVALGGAIDELETRTGLSVTYVVSDDNVVIVEAPSDLQDKIRVKAKDRELDVELKESVRKGLDRVTITVKSPAIYDFDASSGSTIALPQGFDVASGELALSASSGATISGFDMKAATVGLDASSGSVINVGVTADVLACDVSSGSVINLAGSATRVDYEASSGAVIEGVSLKARSGKVGVSSGGRVSCNIVDLFDISKSSGGVVENSRR